MESTSDLSNNPSIVDQGNPEFDEMGKYLRENLERWKKSKQEIDRKHANFYRDYQRIPRTDDTHGTGQARARKAQSIFVGSTRRKVRTARAKLKDNLLYAGREIPFDLKAKKTKLAPLAEAMETILRQQLKDGGFPSALSQGTNTLPVYGTGMIFGPLVRDKTHVETRMDETTFEISEDTYKYPEPYFELGHTMDIVPDPEAKSTEDALGIYWVKRERPENLKKWKNQPSYVNIDLVLAAGTELRKDEGSDLAQKYAPVKEYYNKKDGTVEVDRYFGRIPTSALERFLETAGDDYPYTIEDFETIGFDDEAEVVAIIAGGFIVSIAPSPWSGRVTHRCVYEENEHEFYGTGVAENNEAYQKMDNAAIRLLLEGKSLAMLPSMVVNRSKFLATEDFRLRPGKVWQTKLDMTKEEIDAAIKFIFFPDVTDGWRAILDLSQELGENDTAMPKYTQGNDAKHLNKTAAGLSMIMSAAFLPLKEVLQNIDNMWVIPCLEALIEWDFKYLDAETVRRLHGDDIATKWQAIKKYGKSNLFDYKSTGASTMMAREVMVQKIHGFLMTVTSHPSMEALVNLRELLDTLWEAGNFARTSPVKKEEDLEIDALLQEIEKLKGLVAEKAPMGVGGDVQIGEEATNAVA